jgi:acetyl esterase/lipase
MPSPQLQTIIEMLRSVPIIAGNDVKTMRANMEAATGMMPLPQDVSYEAADAGSVPAEWTQAPGATADRTVLYLHGGGYVMGSVKTHRLLVAGISRAAGAHVLSVDYRLGPEHPFPAAVEDGVEAYRFLLRSGVPANRLAIAGDSAGGGLTVATLIALRDRSEALPAAAVCISPWLDLTLSAKSMKSKAAVDPMVQKERLQIMADAYLSGADARTPTASPLFAKLEGLPPLLIQVGTAETLLDDSTRFAERARAAGVKVDLEAWDDMIHVWHAFAMLLPEGQQAIDRIGQFLRQRWEQ